MIRKAWSYSCFSLGMFSALVATAKAARADEVEANGKGIVGGGLLGAEVVMVGEAAFGVKPAWAYIIGGIVGAGGGALAGHYIEDGADPKLSAYMLAGGMALVIPTAVAVLQATSYRPPDDYTEDHPASGAPVPEPPRPAPGAPPGGASAPAVRAPLALHYHWQEPVHLKLPTGLLALEQGSLAFGVPAIEVRPVYRMQELAMYGLTQQHELRVPFLSATF